MDFGFGLRSREDGHAFTLHHYMKTMFTKAETFNRVFPLDLYFKSMIGSKKEVKIADLGAGMWSTTGSYMEGVRIKIYPSDELAEEYMAGLKAFGVNPLFPIEYQHMEKLTYPDGMFDIVHSVNALDHVENPWKAIKEMWRVCKKGGYIYLRHHFNTARTQKGRGLHAWNITMTINKDCVFYGEKGGFLLSDCISGFINESKHEPPSERCAMLVSICKK
jgi:SAM-dependent methyltransferase